MNSSRGRKQSTPIRQARRYVHFRDLSLVHEGYSLQIPLRSPDISSHGMFINTSHEFPEGTVLKVSFWLSGTNYKVTARCEVSYCLTGVGIGVEFVEISPEAQRAIEEELQITEPSATL